MDYIILYCVCQEVFLFFSLGFTANHTSYLFGLSFDTETGIHLLLDSGGARCQNRTALLVPKTRVQPLHFILHINGAPCRNWTHFWCLQNNCSNHWANGAYILYEPYVHSAFIELVVPISESSSGNYLSCRNYQALPLALRMRVELMLLPWKSSVLTTWPTEHICPASVERDSAISNLPLNFQLSDELTNWTWTWLTGPLAKRYGYEP